MIRYKESILYIVLIVVIFIFTMSKTYPQIASVISNEQNARSLTSQSADLKTKLDALQKAQLEKTTLSDVSKKIYIQTNPGIDLESSFTVMFDDIIDMAKYNGMKIYAIEYNYNPQDDEFFKGGQGKYSVCEVNTEIVSDYQDLQGFLKDLYKYPYLINIDKLQMAPYPKNKRILLTTLSMKLYTSKPQSQAQALQPPAAGQPQTPGQPQAQTPGQPQSPLAQPQTKMP